VLRNQELAASSSSGPQAPIGEPGADLGMHQDDVPDFGQLLQPLMLQDY
jgi:hypothetical protein